MLFPPALSRMSNPTMEVEARPLMSDLVAEVEEHSRMGDLQEGVEAPIYMSDPANEARLDVNKRARELKEEVLTKFPARKEQVYTLWDLICQDQALPRAIHLHDMFSLSSTEELVESLLSSAWEQAYLLEPAIIDPVTSPSPRLLFSHILWSMSCAEDLNSIPDRLHDDSADSFAELFRVSMIRSDESKQAKKVIVIKRAERMRDFWPESVVEALFCLAETADMIGRLCIVTISSLGASHFRTSRAGAANRGPLGAITVHFRRLRKTEVLDVLVGEKGTVMTEEMLEKIPASSLHSLFVNYVSVAYDAFASQVQSLDDLRFLIGCVWYPFIQPLLDGTISTPHFQPLLYKGSRLFQDALDRLATRQMSPSEWIKVACQNNERALVSASVQMPLLTVNETFILLASFLASYNPVRLDVRYFVRDESAVLSRLNVDDGTRKRHRKKGGALRRKPQNKRRRDVDGRSTALLNRQALLGPRAFTLDRLLSIFQALIIESGYGARSGKEHDWEIKCKRISVVGTVNALIRRTLLIRTSNVERLDVTMTLRTNLSHESVVELSKRVQFDIDEWLWDWA